MNDIIYVQHLLINFVFIYENFHRNDNSKERDMEKGQKREDYQSFMSHSSSVRDRERSLWPATTRYIDVVAEKMR